MSGYDSTHPQFGRFHSDENKKVLGKMKDEYANRVSCILFIIFYLFRDSRLTFKTIIY
jgi:hypothetical protein